MNRDGFLLIVTVLVCLFSGYFAGRSDENNITTDRSRIVIDSMASIIQKKDSLILSKEDEYKKSKKTDSVSIFNINRSIKNLYYEIKQQNEATYSVSDSLFAGYVDSLRSARGFYKIQY